MGFESGRKLGDTEGYLRAEYEISREIIKEESVRRNKYFVFLKRAPLLTSVAWDMKNHGLVIQGAYVDYPDDYKNAPPVCISSDSHERINENLGPIYYFHRSGENNEILALHSQEEFDAMNKKAQ